jgi:hypothetical protein
MGLSNNARLCDQIKIDYAGVAGAASAGFDGTSGTMIDMKDYDGCLVLILGEVTTASATHSITGFKVVSNNAAAGGGTDTDIAEAVTTDGGSTTTLTVADFGTSAPTAHNDQMLALDVRADQMAAGDRYIGAVVTNTGTYTFTVVYIRYRGGVSYKDMFQATRTAFQYDGNL